MPFHVREAFQSIRWEDEEQPKLLAELALWAAISDGEIEEHEISAIVTALRQIPALSSFDAEAARAIKASIEALSDEEQVLGRLRAVTSSFHDQQLRRLAYQLAVSCTAQDRMFTETESEFLQGLREIFRIPPSEAKQLIDETLKK